MLKENVNVFNKDTLNNEGYQYTTNAPISSILANKRITKATVALIDAHVKSLVDIGSGDGTYTNNLAEALPGLKISGFDPANIAVVNAQKKFPGIKFFTANLLDSSTFPNIKFDIGVVRGVIHHLSDPFLGIKNAGVMCDKFIIIEPNGNNPILKIIEKKSDYHREHEEQSFSTKQLKEWCEKAGYTVSYINYIGFVPFFCPAWMAKTIYFFQPFLEQIFILKKYLAAQIIMVCEKQKIDKS